MYERIAERIIENGLDEENLGYMALRDKRAVEHILDEFHEMLIVRFIAFTAISYGSLGENIEIVVRNEDGPQNMDTTGLIQYINGLVKECGIELSADNEINETDRTVLLEVIEQEASRIKARIHKLTRYKELGHEQFIAERDQEIRRIIEARQYNILKGMLKVAILALILAVAGKTCSAENSEAAVIDVNHEEVD